MRKNLTLEDLDEAILRVMLERYTGENVEDYQKTLKEQIVRNRTKWHDIALRTVAVYGCSDYGYVRTLKIAARVIDKHGSYLFNSKI